MINYSNKVQKLKKMPFNQICNNHLYYLNGIPTNDGPCNVANLLPLHTNPNIGKLWHVQCVSQLRRGYVEWKQTKMIETQPCMVSFHINITNGAYSKKEEDRCFLSVLLFNYRNNGRFPFQLIILLVSRPHCTRTGRDNLIVGIVFKYT